DDADIRVRDFTGHDILAWAYDLHRPNEPYAARGIHPSGVGIDRYRKPSDLRPEEMQYLRRQGKLQVLNFFDPAFIRGSGFTMNNPLNGRPMKVVVRPGHILTPFG